MADLLRNSHRKTRFPAPDVISLASGDPGFATPAHIAEALSAAVAGGHTHYAEPYGDLQLRAAIVDEIKRRRGADFEIDEVVITHGATGALAAAIVACIEPGDHVLIPDPTYSLYADEVWIAGAEPVFLPLRPDFHLDLDVLEGAAGGARAIVLCTPCNPTGAVLRREELVAVAQLAERHDLLVFSDEVYDSIVYDGVEFTSVLEIPELAQRLVYVQSFSKKYAMTGWRLGYLAAPRPIAQAAARLHFALHGPLNAAVQRAGLAALTTPDDSQERFRVEYQDRRELVREYLESVPGVVVSVPEGGFHALVRYPLPIDSEEMMERCLAAGVAVSAGIEYGPHGEGLLRVSFGEGGSALQEGLARLRRALAAP